MPPVFLALAILGTILAITSIVIALCPPVRKLILDDSTAERVHVLDGLRGVLAICVFGHHIFLAKSYYAGTGWSPPEGNFINLLGQASVALFFMISAYLFWGRVLARHGQMDWRAFFIGRWYRLAPMFYVSVAILFLFIALASDFTLHVSILDLIQQTGRWLCFALFGSPDINNIEKTYTIHSTVWTLKYEWIFYFALPLLAFLFRKLGRAWPIYLAIALYSLRSNSASMYCYFATGCVAVHILNHRIASHREKIIWAILGIIGLITLGLSFNTARGPIQAILLLPVFIAALQAIGPWRWLTSRALQFIGHISYSFYLLHNLMIYAVAKWLVGMDQYGALSPVDFYMVTVLMGLGCIIISTITFRMIEKPFLSLRASKTGAGDDKTQMAAAP